MIVDVMTQDFPPSSGGIASHVDELTKNLSQLDVKIRLFIPCFNKNETGHQRDNFGRSIYRVYRAAPIRNDLSIPRILKTLALIPDMRRCWHKINAKEKSDILHIHNTFYEPIIINSFKRPKVMTEHSSAFLIFSKNYFLRKLISRQFQQMNHIICPSEELAERCKKIGYKGNVSFIPNGVDTDFFSPMFEVKDEKTKKIRETLKGKIILLCPRRLEPKNGVNYLLNALLFLKRNDFHLLIAGDGTMMSEYKKFVYQNNISHSVTFLGNVPKNEIRNYISLASICIFPSLYEAISIACLECMASGKSIIATNVGGLPFLIEDYKNGILVPPKNPESLAKAISYLIDNESIREKMGAHSRKIVVSNFRWKSIAGKTLEIYKNVINNYNTLSQN